MRPQNIIIITFLILSLVITSPKIQSLNSDPTNESKTRRILHQPLFPATSSPPPSPPPPPPQSNEQDQPFFHELPNSGQSQTPPQQPSQTQPSSSNAEVSNPLPSKPSKDATKRTVIASISTILSLALMVSMVVLYIHRRRTRSADGTQKLVGGSSSLVAADEDSRMPPSNFLYIGTVEPSATTLAQETNISSPYRKLNPGKRFERYRPSPDLQPLPPLTKPPPIPPSIHSPPPMSSSDDDDDESSHDTNFYTPQGSSMSNESPRSRKSFLNNNISNNRVSSSALPHSKRTSPKSSRVTATSPDKKPVIIPSIKPQPSSSLGPMQASRTLPYTPIRAKFTAPPPPPDVRRLQSLSNDDDHEMSKTATPPPPPPPPPRPPVLSAQRKLGDVKSDKKTSLSFSLSKISSTEENPSANKDTIPVDDESNKFVMGSSEKADSEEKDGSKPKLKPLHWDKVRATSDRATVWDQLNSSSFQLNEDAMESLFGCNSANSNGKEGVKKAAPMSSLDQEIRVLDPKKSQNIAILLRALNVTKEEVYEALSNGNPEGLGPELLETLVKMAPTKEEEIKLKNYNGEISKLGSAERFLKAILDIPFAFKRVEAMVYCSNFETEVNYLRSSFQTLEEASEELKNSRLFLKLLEAVLRTGNRMNDGTVRGDAKAFKLDTLLKLADVKGTDGKTTLLHFVVQEIIRSEGVDSDNNTSESSVNASNFKFNEDQFRKQGLQVVSGLSKELGNVKKAATMDSDVLSSYVIKLEMGLEKVRSIMEYARKSTQGNFFDSMRDFLNRAAEEIYGIKTEERKALSLVKDVTEYFHGDAAKEEAHPFRVFVIVRDFLSILDNVCKDVGKMQDRATVGAGRSFRMPVNAQLPVLHRYNVVQNDD